MDYLLVAIAAFVLVLQLQIRRMDKRLIEVEHTKAAVDILADQVTELSSDFYGPVNE